MSIQTGAAAPRAIIQALAAPSFACGSMVEASEELRISHLEITVAVGAGADSKMPLFSHFRRFIDIVITLPFCVCAHVTLRCSFKQWGIA